MSDKNYVQRCLNSDVIIYYRCYSNQDHLINKMVAMGKLVVYDIDDYVFQKGGKFNTDYDVQMISRYLDVVNCYMASTKTLLEQMPKNDKPRFIRENCYDQKTFDLLSQKIKRKNVKNGFRVGWTVGINRREMQEFAQKLLMDLDRRNIPNIEFWYFGKMDSFYSFTKKLKNIKCHRLNYIPTGKWKELYKQFRMCDFDVAINPLNEKDIFFHCKSHLKFLEMGALGVPLIVSRVKPFTEIIEEGKNGFFASTPREFVDKILELRADPVLAIRAAMSARKLIKIKWMAGKSAKDFVNNCLKGIDEAKKLKLYGGLKDGYTLDVAQEHFGYLTEVLTQPIVHEFVSTRPGLCRVELLGSTMGRQSNLPLKVIVKNKTTNSVHHERIYNVRDLKDNDWWAFEFEPVPDSQDCTFEVTFMVIGGTVETSVRLYNHIIEKDKGSYSINGNKKQGCLAFKTYCSKFVHDLPREKKPSLKAVEKLDQKPEISIHESSKKIITKDKVKVLIKRKGTVSDILMMTPIIKQLREERGYDIYVATNHQHILLNNEYVAGTIDWNQSMSGIGKRFSLDGTYEKEPRNHPIDVYGKHIIGHSHFDKTIIFNETEQDREKVDAIINDRLLKSKKFVVFHKGVVSKNRTWPEDRWKRLEAHTLAQGYNVFVIGHGGDFEASLPQSINLVNKLTHQEGKYLISKAKALVCIDGDYLQIAGATETPVVSIFTATEPNYRLPYRVQNFREGVVPVRAPIECFGCWHDQINASRYHGCNRKDFACMNTITPKMILDCLNKL